MILTNQHLLLLTAAQSQDMVQDKGSQIIDSLKIIYKKRMFYGLPHRDAATYS